MDDSPISRVGFVPEHGISLKDFKRRFSDIILRKNHVRFRKYMVLESKKKLIGFPIFRLSS